ILLAGICAAILFERNFSRSRQSFPPVILKPIFVDGSRLFVAGSPRVSPFPSTIRAGVLRQGAFPKSN
ncbi:MAG: hypothetical protein WBS22_07810, partial [Methylocystis sp.]